MIPKFRAWHKKYKRYFYPNSIKFNVHSENNEIEYITIEPDYKHNVVMQADDIILEQSTRVKDKYGKEIFEGDIVKWKDDKFEVKYKNDKYNVGYVATIRGDTNMYIHIWYDGLEIIGNVHEESE